jgi:uncharacterized protein YeaO (DUF488 family)
MDRAAAHRRAPGCIRARHGVRYTPSMRGEIRTRRWNDPALPDDGFRLLVCRYRPRGVRKADETWDAWWKALGPSPALHAAFYGKGQPPIDDAEYRRRYVAETSGDAAQACIRAVAARVATGETVTLLCSSACTDESRCHRTLLRALVTARCERTPSQ